MSDDIIIPAPVADAPAEEKRDSFSLTDSIFALIFTFSGFFFLKTIITSRVGIGAALFLLILAAASMVYVRMTKSKQSGKSIILFVGTVIFSANLAVTSNGLIQALDFIFAVILYAVWAFSVNNDIYRGADDYTVYRIVKALFGQSFGNIGKCPSAVISLMKKSKGGKNIGNAVIGLIIAVPCTVVVALLLASADDNFDSLLGKITDNFFSDFFVNVLKYAVMLPLSFLIFGIIFSAVKGKNRLDTESCDRTTAALKIAPSAVMYFSVIPVCILYVLFFFSQISYFLSAFGGILPEGFSAAEYARQGFFELCAVSVINLSIIIAINLLCKTGESGERPKGLKFFTALISCFTIVLIATALSKMIMYISRFGMTCLRFYTSWFMVLLAALFVLIIIRQFKDINLAAIGTIIFTVMFSLLSLLPTDALIARYNIYAYEHFGTDFDKSYFYELSEEACYNIPYMLESGDQKLMDTVHGMDAYHTYNSKEWYEMTLSEYIAKNICDSYK